MNKKNNAETKVVENVEIDMTNPEDIATIMNEMKMDKSDFLDYTQDVDLTKTMDLAIITMNEHFVLPFSKQRVVLNQIMNARAFDWGFKNGSTILIVAQKDEHKEINDIDNFYSTGVLAQIKGAIPNDDDTTENGINIDVFIKAENRMKIDEVYYDHSTEIFKAKCSPFPNDTSYLEDEESKEIITKLWNDIDKTTQQLHPYDEEYKQTFHLINETKKHLELSPFLIYFYLHNSTDRITFSQIQEILDEPLVLKQMFILNKNVNLLEKLMVFRKNLHNEAAIQMEKLQREYYVNEEIKILQNSISSGNPDVEALRKEMETKFPPKDIMDTYNRELDKLKRVPTHNPDYAISLNYLQTVASLPWGIYSEDNLNLKRAKKKLDQDHYGLEEVKERILEHLAVLKLNKSSKSPIICLYGPPGVGKTSLGRSVAEALNRKYQRISLGGIHDESEIRGHRRTYLGAMPGRIIKGLMKAKTANPVFILDEIDKVSDDTHRGDPHSALLEVLDPEQNNKFHDNFIDLDFDLSKVLFIATANDLNTIPAPLLDRMEVINVSGYIAEEKYQIAKRHLLPKALVANGVNDRGIKMAKPVVMQLIDQYTRESGVRQLEKQLNKIARKLAYQVALDADNLKPNVTKDNLATYLGLPIYNRDMYQGNRYAGVVTGLAWTPVGGEILFIETSLSRGKGTLTLTGNLGDVMKESAMLALEYIKAHAEALHIDSSLFTKWNIHLHVPEGAIPKDGPSAGITMATALVSAFTQCKVKAYLAMTGEITLRGRVIPVGGIREKVLAARRAGIREIILCAENKNDVEKIKPEYLSGLQFHFVNDMTEVIDYALTKDQVNNAIDLNKKIVLEETKL